VEIELSFALCNHKGVTLVQHYDLIRFLGLYPWVLNLAYIEGIVALLLVNFFCCASQYLTLNDFESKFLSNLVREMIQVLVSNDLVIAEDENQDDTAIHLLGMKLPHIDLLLVNLHSLMVLEILAAQIDRKVCR